jgi:hypothetical protein
MVTQSGKPDKVELTNILAMKAVLCQLFTPKDSIFYSLLQERWNRLINPSAHQHIFAQY